MTTSNTSDIEGRFLPDGVELIEDPDGIHEDHDYSVNAHLNLRCVSWPTDGAKASHPDQRPCPTWCWVGHHEEYGHEINPNNPWMAEHHTDWTIKVGASLYRGDKSSDHISSATIEPNLVQTGAGKPRIIVGLRTGGEYIHNHLKLSMKDAEELIEALTFLVEVADGRRA